MKVLARRAYGFVAAPALLAVTLIGLAGPASAAPYGHTTLQLTVSDPDPNAGQTITGTITGAGAGNPIRVVIDSTPVTLATLVADAHGDASGALTIPCDYSGGHTIVATDSGTGASSAVPITVEAATNPACTDARSLASTGTDVEGVGGVALAVLASGGAVLILARRRSRSFHSRRPGV